MSLRIAGQIAAAVTGVGSISTGIWYKLPKNKITPPLSAVVSSIFQTSKRDTLKVPGTHIPKESIKSYKWIDDEIVLDWTADSNASTPYFLAEMTDGTFTQGGYANEFNIKTVGDKWVEIECNGCSVCMPVYKFSDDPQKLEDLDFSKLVRLQNKNGEKWQKYLVFDLDKSRMEKHCQNIFFHPYRHQDNKAINHWGNVYKDKSKPFPTGPDSQGENKNYLWVELLINNVISEPKLKIINFLTPNFDLDEAIKKA